MRYYLDTEFIDNGRTIDLISIGIACEDGREYYAEVHPHKYDITEASQWVKDNVIAHLTRAHERSRIDIALDLLRFIRLESEKPELWGWCAGYDFVAFCQLFGQMIDLPKGWPHYIKDLQYVLDERGILDEELPVQEEGLHNALEDARHIKKLYEYITSNNIWT